MWVTVVNKEVVCKIFYATQPGHPGKKLPFRFRSLVTLGVKFDLSTRMGYLRDEMNQKMVAFASLYMNFSTQSINLSWQIDGFHDTEIIIL